MTPQAEKGNIGEYITSLKASERLGDQVAHHAALPEKDGSFAEPARPWPEHIRRMLQFMGIEALYAHQADAVNLVRAGRHVIVSTPTASGKTLIYNLPVLEKIAADPGARSLYLFPLKALAQDQLKTFREMAAFCPDPKPTAEIYDGDTTAWFRKKIRQNPPNVILTNPEMLHLSVLPHHEKWAAFLSDLDIVVVDEVHAYRGVMGSHMAQVFRRFRRICRLYGADPVFVFSSATIGNPKELAEQLADIAVTVVSGSGAPQGRKHLICMDPVQSPAQTAILLLKAALHRRLRTIVYTQSRKYAELIALWAGSRSGRFRNKISAYRAGFLPEERREIETGLSNGDLLAVISTSALELGIDIGDLDLCILVGYPGSIIATWQRGGRVGRGGQESALVLVAGEDALDRYLLRHPEELLQRRPESAVINPHNDHILKQHLVCAAAESPLKADEPMLDHPVVRRVLAALEESCDLLRSGDGLEIFSRRKAPHRDVDLRGAGGRFNIVCANTGEDRGEIDGFRAFRETHPGAVYLHGGETYLVESLDLGSRTVKVVPEKGNYYTRVRADKTTEILETLETSVVRGVRIGFGRLKVTDQVTGYAKWQIRAGRKIGVYPLDLPPQMFETEGMWLRIPLEIQRAAEDAFHHFMGGIHAMEHAAIGVFPLVVMADRNDLGGISSTFHPELDSAAVFIYDGVPGGAGLTRHAFKRAADLLDRTHKVVRDCPCENGCPSCVHSPKCGSGNRPIDKAAALFIMENILGTSAVPRARTRPVRRPSPTPEPETTAAPPKAVSYGVLDVETRRSADEVGGWHRADRMGISCAVLYDSSKDAYEAFLEDRIPDLQNRLGDLDLIVGFNIKRFDYAVLKGYSDFNFKSLPTLDMLEMIHNRLGYRLSLDNLAGATLGAKKTADGLQALRWWKAGRLKEIIDYCTSDVRITRDLYLFGRQNGYLMFKNKDKAVVRAPVDW